MAMKNSTTSTYVYLCPCCHQCCNGRQVHILDAWLWAEVNKEEERIVGVDGIVLLFLSV
jgi:hypothetical protein